MFGIVFEHAYIHKQVFSKHLHLTSAIKVKHSIET